MLHAERLGPTKTLPVERGRERAILGSIAESINLESPTPVTKEVISSSGYNKQRQHLRRLTTGKKGINKCRLQLFVCRQVSKVAAHPARSPVVGPGARGLGSNLRLSAVTRPACGWINYSAD